MTAKENSSSSESASAMIPNEFSDFVKEAGIRAFDALAAKLAPSKKVDDEDQTRMQKLAAHWNTLEASEKSEFFAQVIAAAAMISAAAPALKTLATTSRKSVRTAAAKKVKASLAKSPAKSAESDDEEKKGKKSRKDKKEKKEKKKAKKK